MNNKMNAVLFLRITAMLMVFVGLAAFAASFVGSHKLSVAGLHVPIWLFAAAGVVCGARNWMRMKKIEQQAGI
jgi:hypothetical protein